MGGVANIGKRELRLPISSGPRAIGTLNSTDTWCLAALPCDFSAKREPALGNFAIKCLQVVWARDPARLSSYRNWPFESDASVLGHIVFCLVASVYE